MNDSPANAIVGAAIGMAEDGDIILFAGKGHEDYQLINGKKEHFVEREIIKEACAEISKSNSGPHFGRYEAWAAAALQGFYCVSQW